MSTLLPPWTAAQGPVALELPVGLSAWEACQRLAGWPHLLFLDSAQTGPLGRYSFVSADPFAFFRVGPEDPDPFPRLSELTREFHQPTLPELPPFQGGWAGMWGYDLAHHIERLPRPLYRDFDFPVLALGAYDWVAAFDHHENRGWLISTGWPEKNPARRQRRARQRLEDVLRRLDEPADEIAFAPLPLRTIETPTFPVSGRDNFFSNFSPELYRDTIARTIEYIHAGDCFQANIAQRLLTPLKEVPLTLYGKLRERNPAPFAGYFDLGRYVLASASPERFLRLDDGDIETRPIKGTRPRSLDPVEDRRIAQELQASPKDRAENVMIVDLLRNDLGRVCEFRSVHVEALCRLESYQFVHHLVSAIRGRLRPGLNAVDLLRATLPGGSVTGAPKIRAMEIIAELERTARGPYCGCLGYLGFDGSMDTNLLIRTLVLGDGWAQFSVGGGIVADSDPEREYQETWHKAAGLFGALA